MDDQELNITRIEPEQLSDKARIALIKMIRSNAGPNDAPFKLPNEDELSRRLGVSRNVLRDALMSLEEMGLVTRRRGRGTIANAKIAWANRLDISPYIVDAVRREGKKTWFKTLGFGYVDEPDPAFGVAEPGYFKLEKVFFSGDDPVAYTENRILGKYGKMAVGRFDGKVDINHTEFVRQYCDTSVEFTITDINILLAGDVLAGLLETTPERPLLMLEDNGFNPEQEMIIHSFTYYREDVMPLKFVRKYWNQGRE